MKSNSYSYDRFVWICFDNQGHQDDFNLLMIRRLSIFHITYKANHVDSICSGVDLRADLVHFSHEFACSDGPALDFETTETRT